MMGARECDLEVYTCTEDDNTNNPRCPIASFDKVQEASSELFLIELGSSDKEISEFTVWWEDVKLLLRMEFDNSGMMFGFHAGGKTHRGLSLRNMTKLYRHALVLGGEDPKNLNKYSYHGCARGGISIQKSIGGMFSREVALGSKHSLGDITDEYTDPNRCQIAGPVKCPCDLRDQMEAVLEAKKQQKGEEK